MPPDKHMTMNQAAALKGVSRQAIFYAIQAGKIRVVAQYGNVKLVSRGDVERYQPRRKP